MMKSLYYILLFLLCSKLVGQNPKEDFKKINKNYSEMKKVSFNVRYELFFDNSKSASDKQESLYKRNHDNYLVKNEDNEVLINGKYIIVIDKESKVVIVDISKFNNNPLNPLNLDIDSIFHFYEKVVFYKTGVSNELNAYTFHLKDGPYTTIDIVFDPNTFLIKEMINVYREKMPDENDVERKAKLKTTFYNVNVNPVSKDDFDESKYLIYKNKKIILTTAYSTYKLLTNLKKL